MVVAVVVVGVVLLLVVVVLWPYLATHLPTYLSNQASKSISKP